MEQERPVTGEQSFLSEQSKTKAKGWMLVVALGGVFLGGAVHFATYQGLNLPQRYPWLWVLHVLGIGVVGAFVLLTVSERQNASRYMTEVLFRPVWPFLLCLALVIYAGLNFMLNVPAGSYAVKDGKYVRHNKSKITRVYRSKERFERDRQRASLHTARAFSGHWLFFFGFVSVLLVSDLRRRRLDPQGQKAADAHDDYPLPPETIGQEIVAGHTVELPPQGELSFRQRLSKHTAWRFLLYGIPPQILLCWVIGYFARSGFWIFAGFFLSLAFLNYFPLRNQVRDYLKAIRLEGDSCHLEFYRFDTLERLDVPLSQLFLRVEEKMRRGFAYHHLRLYQQQTLLLDQQCDVGFWSKARCDALVQALYQQLPSPSPQRGA